MMRDPEFGPVRIRAFGSFAIKVKDAGTFIKNIAGTESRFTTDEIEQQLRDMVVSRFADALGNNKMPVLDLAGNYDKVSRWASASIQPDFDTFGLADHATSSWKTFRCRRKWRRRSTSAAAWA